MNVSRSIRWFAPLVGVALFVVACGRKEEPPAAPPMPPPAPTAEMEAPMPPPPAAPAVTEPAAPAATGPVAQAKDALGRLVQAFAGADAGTRSTVDQIVTAVKGGAYSKALPMLQQLLANAQLTPGQQTAVNDTVTDVRQQMATEAVADPAKAATDLQKTLPLGQ